MTDTAAISWNSLMRWRTECFQRFGGVLDLPVVNLHAEIEKLFQPGVRILDVGAGAHQPLKAAALKAGASYFCMDTDPSGDFDYGSMEDIPSGLDFDVAVSNQVLEHLPIGDAFALLGSIQGVLSTTGTLLATVPNAAHPVRQWDCTHVTAWPMNDLYSLIRSAGLNVTEMARYNKFPLTRNPLKRWVVKTACEAFRIDWCDSLMIVAQKGA